MTSQGVWWPCAPLPQPSYGSEPPPETPIPGIDWKQARIVYDNPSYFQKLNDLPGIQTAGDKSNSFELFIECDGNLPSYPLADSMRTYWVRKPAQATNGQFDSKSVRATLIKPFQHDNAAELEAGSVILAQPVSGPDGSPAHFQLRLAAGLWSIGIISKENGHILFGLQLFVPVTRTQQIASVEVLKFYPLADFALAAICGTDASFQLGDANDTPKEKLRDIFEGVVPSNVTVSQELDTLLSLLYDVVEEAGGPNVQIVFELDLPEPCRGNRVIVSPVRWSTTGFKTVRPPKIEEYGASIAYALTVAPIVAQVSVLRGGVQYHPRRKAIEYTSVGIATMAAQNLPPHLTWLPARDTHIVASFGLPMELPMHTLATTTHVSVMKGILKHHPTFISLEDRNQITPLHLAVWAGTVEMVLLLLINGANSNKADDCGNTPLRIAESIGDQSLVELLRWFNEFPNTPKLSSSSQSSSTRGSKDSNSSFLLSSGSVPIVTPAPIVATTTTTSASLAGLDVAPAGPSRARKSGRKPKPVLEFDDEFDEESSETNGVGGKARSDKPRKPSASSTLAAIVPSPDGPSIPPPTLLESVHGKPRLVWSNELHTHFEKCVQQLGPSAFPSAILKLMNVPGVTRDHVASHLQKYRQRHGLVKSNASGDGNELEDEMAMFLRSGLGGDESGDSSDPSYEAKTEGKSSKKRKRAQESVEVKTEPQPTQGNEEMDLDESLFSAALAVAEGEPEDPNGSAPGGEELMDVAEPNAKRSKGAEQPDPDDPGVPVPADPAVTGPIPT